MDPVKIRKAQADHGGLQNLSVSLLSYLSIEVSLTCS